MRIASTPESDGLEIFTRPARITWSASPGSPWWKMTSPRRKRRIRHADASVSRSSSGSSRKSGTSPSAAESVAGSGVRGGNVTRAAYLSAAPVEGPARVS